MEREEGKERKRTNGNVDKRANEKRKLKGILITDKGRRTERGKVRRNS